MNHDPSSPPSSRRQPENSDPSQAGHEWNNRITRRSFLKRTGGATLATMVTWHASGSDSFAQESELIGNSDLNLWWETKRKANGVDVIVPNSKHLSVAEATKLAIKIIDDTAPGTVISDHKQMGGTVLNPPRYSTSQGGITVSKQANGDYIVHFPPGLEYKKEVRE